MGLLGMAVLVGMGGPNNARIRPIYRWLAGFAALLILLGTAASLYGRLMAGSPPATADMSDAFLGLIGMLFGYAAVRGRSWF
jgi:hypothetical protein